MKHLLIKILLALALLRLSSVFADNYPNREAILQDISQVSSGDTRDIEDVSMLNEAYFEYYRWTNYSVSVLRELEPIIGLNLITAYNFNFTLMQDEVMAVVQVNYNAFDFDVGETTVFGNAKAKRDSLDDVHVLFGPLKVNCTELAFTFTFYKGYQYNSSFHCLKMNPESVQNIFIERYNEWFGLTNSSTSFHDFISEDEELFAHTRLDTYDAKNISYNSATTLLDAQLLKATSVAKYIMVMAFLATLDMKAEQTILSFNPEEIANPLVSNLVVINQKTLNIENWIDSQPKFKSFILDYEQYRSSLGMDPKLIPFATTVEDNKDVYTSVFTNVNCKEYYDDCSYEQCEDSPPGEGRVCKTVDREALGDNCDAIRRINWSWDMIHVPAISDKVADFVSLKTVLPNGISFQTSVSAVARSVSKDPDEAITQHILTYVKKPWVLEQAWSSYACDFKSCYACQIYHSSVYTFRVEIERYRLRGDLVIDLPFEPYQINADAFHLQLDIYSVVTGKPVARAKYIDPIVTEVVSGAQHFWRITMKEDSAYYWTVDEMYTYEFSQKQTCDYMHSYVDELPVSYSNQWGEYGETMKPSTSSGEDAFYRVCSTHNHDLDKYNFTVPNEFKIRDANNEGFYSVLTHVDETKRGQPLFYYLENSVDIYYVDSNLNSVVDDLNQLAVRFNSLENRVQSLEEYVEAQKSSLFETVLNIGLSLTALGSLLSDSIKTSRAVTTLNRYSASRKKVSEAKSVADDFSKIILKNNHKISSSYNPVESINDASNYALISKHYKPLFRSNELKKDFVDISTDDFFNFKSDLAELAHINPTVHLQFQTKMYERFEGEVTSVLGGHVLPFGAVSVHKSPIEQAGVVGKFFSKKFDGTKQGQTFLNNGHYRFPFHTSVSSNSFEYVDDEILFTIRHHGIGEASVVGPTNAKNPRVKIGYVKIQYRADPTSNKLVRLNWNEIKNPEGGLLYDEAAIDGLFKSFSSNIKSSKELTYDEKWDFIVSMSKNKFNSRDVIDTIPLSNQVFHEVVDDLVSYSASGNVFSYSLLNNNCQVYAQVIAKLLSTGKFEQRISDVNFRELAERLQKKAYSKFKVSEYFNYYGSEVVRIVRRIPEYMYEHFQTVKRMFRSG